MTWEKIKREAEEAASRGDLDKASDLWLQGLEFLDNVPDSDTRLAVCLDLYADCLSQKGSIKAAIPLREYLVMIRQKALGSDHVEVANCLNTLTELLYSIGEFERAQPLSEQIMYIYEKNFGSDHLGLAMIATFLAMIYHGQKNFDKAEELYQIALNIKQKVLGYNHNEVALLMENYAGLLCATNREDEAENMYSNVGTASGVWRLVSAQTSEQLTSGRDGLRKTLTQTRKKNRD